MVMTVKPDMTKIWAATGATAVPPDAKIASGWGYEMMPFEWENWIQNRNDSMLSHINQRGIPEWDAASEYFANKSYVTGSNGLVYFCLVNSTNINPVTDGGSNWVRAFPSITGGGASGTWAISVSGNAATATQFATARTINSVSFNGTANIIVEPYVERDDATNATRYLSFVDSSTAGHQRLNIDLDLTYNPSTNTISTSVTGNSGTATKWATARSISITGDATWTTSIDGSANATGVLTLANSGVTAGTYNNAATAVTPITVDAKGRVTATGAAITITPAFSNVTGKPTTLTGYGITDGQPLDAELTAISGLTTNGIIAKTAADAATTRSIAVSGVGLGISNADGVAGNPTVSSNATNLNTASAIVARDASGNFSAGTVTAALSGNATTATTLQTARSITLSGDATGTASFNGSADAGIAVTLANSGVTAGTWTKVSVDAKGRVTSGANQSAADIPALDTSKLTTGTLPVARGGTNLTASVQGGVLYGASTSTNGFTAAGTQNQALISNGTGAPSFVTLDLTYLPDASVKKSVRAATTANITLSAAQTVDGIALVAGDRVLVKDQTSSPTNGIYIVQGGAWTRAADADTSTKLAGAIVNVDSGTSNGGLRFDTDFKTTDTLDTTNMVWSRVVDTGMASSVAGSAHGTAAVGTSLSYARADHVHPVQTSVSGNAGTATSLATARTINGVSFNGTANITVPATSGGYFGITNTDVGSGHGLSLYGTYSGGKPSYGLTFSGTPTLGTHGEVTGDWATYLTMTGASTRGWIFKHENTNVASVSATGVVTAAGFVGPLTGNAATATTATNASNISNTGTVTLASATESNAITITAPAYSTDKPVKLLNFDWYGSKFSLGNIRSGNTLSDGFGIYYTASGGTIAEIARFGVSGTLNVVGAITQAGNQVLHAGNYNSYAPTLTGTGASGSWPINVTGSSASTTGNAATATALATGRTIGMTGDVTWTSASFNGSANVTGTATLSNSGVTAGTYNNSATAVTPITVDAKGRVTATGAAVTVTPAWGSITGKPTTISGYGITDAVAKTAATGAAYIPTGTSAQRPAGTGGMFRFNSDTQKFEGYYTTAAAWGEIGGGGGGGGAAGGGTDAIFFENDQAVTTNYTITSGKNAMSAGPITINSGITVTVPSGSTWVIV